MSTKSIKNLVIVESPAKSKTIAKYLGPDFKVMSSIGHIRSIAKKAAKGVEPIDTAHEFATVYEIDPEKKKIVAELRAAVKEADTVWLATDEDREGEAIAWHLCEVLKLDPAKTNRIVFHEITKHAIEEAVKNPRHIDMDLVKAQQARQILDRLVGFELSPVVWRKVPGGKSAGRVQSPAVRLLVEREREIAAFESSSVFKVSGEFSKDSISTSFAGLSGGSSNDRKNPKNLPIVQRQIVSGFIFSNDNKILLGHKRDRGGVFSKLWHTPGGGVEGGEDEISALHREMAEETGLDISPAKIKKVYTGSGADERTLASGETVWCEMAFNNYEVKIDAPAAEIKISDDDDLTDLRWFAADEIIESEQMSETLKTLQKIGFLKSTGEPSHVIASKAKQSIVDRHGNKLPRDDNADIVKANLSTDFPDEKSATEFLESLIGANYSVADIETNAGTRKPLPPFTTSTMQQDANARLGMSARTTMSLAQQLYQQGKITYMRTDSMNLSGQALAQMSTYIKKEFGEKYYQTRKFKTKSAGAQEAHEAIRPTDVGHEFASDDARAQKLYDLIRRRTLATQMADAKIERTTVTIDINDINSSSFADLSGESSCELLLDSPDKSANDENLYFIAKGEVILFDGFLKMYGTNKEEILPALTAGDELTAQEITARQTFARPPARYTEGSLVKKLEELGIGRPSTYATIIDTIQTRGYAERGDSEGDEREVIELKLAQGEANSADQLSARLSKDGERVSAEPRNDGREKRRGEFDTQHSPAILRSILTEKSGATKGKLVPTASGSVVTDFLNQHFTDIDDYDFTAKVETELDEIAEAKLDKTKMLRQFYDPFHKKIEGSDTIERSQVAGQKELGKDPKTGEPIFARIGRYGPMLQMGETSRQNPDGSDDKTYKPRFANFPKDARLETITLEQALKMFELPRAVGTTTDGQEITAAIGRFGPYIKVKSTFVSIKPLSPFEITEDEARKLYADKLAADAAKNIADFGDGVKVLNGRFGPYVTDGKKNAKIPKDVEPKSITHEQAKEMIASAPEKKGRFARTSRGKSNTKKKK